MVFEFEFGKGDVRARSAQEPPPMDLALQVWMRDD
jgi:hypothetical protein